MSGARQAGGSRYLYDSFDVAAARIEANERVAEERWSGLEYRLRQIEVALERVERRLWLAVYGLAGVVLANGARLLLEAAMQ